MDEDMKMTNKDWEWFEANRKAQEEGEE